MGNSTKKLLKFVFQFDSYDSRIFSLKCLVIHHLGYCVTRKCKLCLMIHLLHSRQILYWLSYQGSPIIFILSFKKWVSILQVTVKNWNCWVIACACCLFLLNTSWWPSEKTWTKIQPQQHCLVCCFFTSLRSWAVTSCLFFVCLEHVGHKNDVLICFCVIIIGFHR